MGFPRDWRSLYRAALAPLRVLAEGSDRFFAGERRQLILRPRVAAYLSTDETLMSAFPASIRATED
jgi:hypothetical protein